LNPSEPSGATLTQLIVVATIFIAYTALSYYSDSVPKAAGLAAGLSLAPVLLIGAVFLWRWTRPLIAWSIIIVAAALLYRYWAFLKDNYRWSNLIQQAGTYGLIALGFARSLMPGRIPVCTHLAEKAHCPLIPAEIAYMRRATGAWALFYLLLTAAILIVYFAAPVRVWSLFVNFATFGLIGLMFVIEHTVRRKLLPQRPGSTRTALRHLLGG
jgi:uncharacterized membrane protein